MATPTLVHHYHPDTNVYLGSSEADESPLEPGVFLVPANATLTAPEAMPGTGQHNVWDAATSTWTPQDIPPVPPTDPTLPPIPEELPPAMDQLRNLRNKRLADVDWVAIKYFTMGLPYPAEWAAYVQALRDLPATVGELQVDDEGRLVESSVNWPVQPAA